MPFVDIAAGRLWYEESGSGRPILCLHGGWGRRVMPFDDAAEVLGRTHRVILLDRRGYGRSTPLGAVPAGFHREAAGDVEALVERLDLRDLVLWGHSDGAIIAAFLAATRPDRVAALVLEAVHYYRRKSIEFFATLARDPQSLPPHIRERLAADHGEPYWSELIAMHSRAWTELNRQGGEFYEGLLETIGCPTLLLHGDRDLHTPLAEIRALARHLHNVELEIIPGGEHSPHSESRNARFCSGRVARFLADRGLS